MTLERGTLLHKRYRIVEILGQGGMGSVYRAVDENLGVDVAVKENLFTTDEYARQFRLEAVILANLRHPNLPRVSDHFVIGDQGQYLVMDFIEGEDLRQRMERFGTINDEDAIMIGAAMCDALTYLHTRRPSILHRDIKPGNVKITSDGHIYLVDFGLAKVLQGSQATTTGARAMTPGYSPPEQYGTARTDARTDVYSLGATLYAGLCGMIPEDGLARAMDNAQLTPLRKRNPKVSRRLAAAIEKAMAVDPADRFQNAEEFKKALLGSNSKTQRSPGDYTVVPPPDVPAPSIENKAEAGQKQTPTPQPVMEEEKPFVPPNKRRRKRNPALSLFLIFLILLFGTVAVLPTFFPGAIHAILPFVLGPSATATLAPTELASPTLPPTETPTAEPPTATATQTKSFLFSTSVPVAGTPPTATPADLSTPLPTPMGGGYAQIAFASDRTGIPQIYLTDLISGQTAPVTKMPEGACEPSWAPDGRQLVFVSPCRSRLDLSADPPKDTALYVINVDGTGLTPLPTVPGADLEPAWSPDGTRIAFTSLRDGHMQIYVMNLSDLSVLRLTNTPLDVDARQPSWSPFSNQIVYALRRVDVYQIWSMTDTGEGQQQIIRRGQEFWDYNPVWSTDGKIVLFNERDASGPVQPWIMSVVYENRNSDIATKQKLGASPIEDIEFSPDGFWLVFESMSTDNNRDIFYTTVTGAQRTQLTKDPGSDFDPTWRPSVTP